MALKPLTRQESWLRDDLSPTERFANLLEEIIRELESMTANAQLFITRPSATSATSVYTAPASSQGGRGTVINQFSGSDPAGAATFHVYIGTSAGAATKVAHAITAAAVGTSVTAIIGAVVKPGDSIFVECSAGNTIVFCCSGTERRN